MPRGAADGDARGDAGAASKSSCSESPASRAPHSQWAIRRCPVVDRGHLAIVGRGLPAPRAPRRGRRLAVAPVSTSSNMLRCRWRYVSKTLPIGRTASVKARGSSSAGACPSRSTASSVADALRGRQVPLLLAYLVLNRDRHVGREELIGALWPVQAPRSQDAALRTLLSRLRSALGTDALRRPRRAEPRAPRTGLGRHRGGGHRGRARAAGARARRRAQRLGAGAGAAQHRRPRPAAGHAGALARAAPARARGRAAAGAGGDRARGAELGGTQLASVERAARSLIEAEPYRESGYVLLMEALAPQGNVAEGLRVFDRLRTLLRDELGTMPSPETIAVHERLLHPGGRAGAAGAARRRRGAAVELPPELARARRARRWSGAARARGARASCGTAATGERRGRVDRGRIVLIAGDPGIGKTRLAAELARRRCTREGACVLAGRAPQETLVAYQPFLEALRHYVLNVPDRRAASDRARVRRRARPADPRAAPAGARAAAASRRRARDRALPPVRGRRRAARRDLGAAPRSCSCSTTSSGPTARRCCCCATWRGRGPATGC